VSESDWVRLSEVPSIADERWLAHQNGAPDGNESPQDSWAPRNLSEVPDEPPVRPTLGGMQLCYPGKRHVLSGPQESAKTLVAYVLLLAVVREGKRVVLIDFEMGDRDAKMRMRELGASEDELALVAYVDPDEPARPDAMERLISLEPGAVLIDAAAGAFDVEGLDDNSRKDVERWASRWIRPFNRAGIATIVLDHVTKNVDSRGSYAIGSERKVGGVDVHLGFTTLKPIKRGSDGLYKITTHKDRGGFHKRGHLCDFKFVSDAESHAIEWEIIEPQVVDEEHPFRPTGLMEKVSRYLELVAEPPVSRNQVEKDVSGKGEYIRLALDILVSEGFVGEIEGPKRARLVSSIEAYREAFDSISPSSSPVRPQFVPEPANLSSSVRPPPLGGRSGTKFVPEDEVSSSQRTLEANDGIPF
jgi:KaiC/GvpD/RAD55 family RecA-like ATPase